MKATVTVRGKEFSFPFKTAIHTDGKKHPFFLHINFRSETPDLYQPTEEILDNGFNIISFCYKDITSDDGDFSTGLADIFVGTNDRTPTLCGKIILWAWTAMRLLDYAETEEAFDMEKSAVVGHSRLGKTALVTGMFDERVKFVISNNAGLCGATLFRDRIGEQITDITKNFPYWFCENLKKYRDNHHALPYDSHFLLATIAPRYLYVASSEDDLWSDPTCEFLACVAVSDCFKAKGAKNGFICPDRLPEVPEHFHEGEIGYHERHGDHYFSRYDWNMYMKFIKSKIGEM